MDECLRKYESQVLRWDWVYCCIIFVHKTATIYYKYRFFASRKSSTRILSGWAVNKFGIVSIILWISYTILRALKFLVHDSFCVHCINIPLERTRRCIPFRNPIEILQIFLEDMEPVKPSRNPFFGESECWEIAVQALSWRRYEIGLESAGRIGNVYRKWCG